MEKCKIAQKIILEINGQKKFRYCRAKLSEIWESGVHKFRKHMCNYAQIWQF